VNNLGYVRSALWGVTLPKDVMRLEANRVDNERRQSQGKKVASEHHWDGCKGTGEETPSKPESSGDDDVEENENEEEGEITPSHQSPP
jgi:hypothetical protein